MTVPTLFVPVAEVAFWLELDPLLLTPRQTTIITRSILTAQGKVADYLNRTLEPTTVVLSALWQDDRYEQTDVKAWPEAARAFDDTYRAVSAAANVDDASLWDVTFLVGLDVVGNPKLASITNFVLQDTLESLTNGPFMAEIKRQVKSVSAEGQSVTYVGRAASADTAGAQLTISSLKRWKRYGVGTPPNTVDPRPWPYRR